MLNVYISLATTFVAVSYAQLADNVALNGATKCNNYIRIDHDELYPVGRCYSENTDPNQIDPSGYTPYTQNYMYTCSENAAGTGKQACLFRMGAGCNGVINDAETCYPCNGADDECECVVGGDASECSLYEETTYDTLFSFSGYYCNKKTQVVKRTVVNMCIQAVGVIEEVGSSLAYECGGYDDRSRKYQDYSRDVTYHTNAECVSDVAVPTSYPTTMTDAPSSSPTEEGGSDWSWPYCSESTCDGVESPWADDMTPTTTDHPVTEQSDIIFLLDSSSGVSYESFLDQMEFVGIMMDCFETYEDGDTKPKVSVMTYGDKVRKLSDLDVNSEDDMIGGDRWTDNALAKALEQFEESGSSDKWIVLMLNDAPMMNHEPCLDDYVSPTLQKLRNMDVYMTTMGINLGEEEMNNLLCMVPEDMRDEINIEDYLVNTDTMVNLAQKWGYEDCANGLSMTYYDE